MQYKKFYEYAPLLILGFLLFFFANNTHYIGEISRITRPILWGVALSYLMNPVCKFLMKKTKASWSINILIGYILLFIVVGAFLWGFLPIVGQNIADLINSIPGIAKALQNLLIETEKSLAQGPLEPLMEQLDLKSFINQAFSKFGVILNNVSNWVVVFFKGLSQFILGLIISIYMLLNKDPIDRKSVV